MPSPQLDPFQRASRRFRPGIPAIGWALLSQSIWLPLLAIDAHDRWQSRVRELKPELPAVEVASQDGRPDAAGGLASPSVDGHLLGSRGANRDPWLDLGVTRSQDVPAMVQQAPASSAQPKPLRLSTRGSGLVLRASPRQSSPSPLALAQPQRPAAPDVDVNDPLAPLPSAWREPMRRALQQLPTAQGKQPALTAARVIYIPSTRISAPTTVPLAIQPDGSVDIFSLPKDAMVMEEVRNWSNRQPQRSKGRITPVVVHLSPIPSQTTAMVSPPRSVVTLLRSSDSASRATPLAPPPPLPPLPVENAASAAAPADPAAAAPAKVTASPSEALANGDANRLSPAAAPVAAVSSSEATASLAAPEPTATATPAASGATTSDVAR